MPKSASDGLGNG